MNEQKKIILNLGCGKTRIPNSIGVDRVLIDNFVDIVHDLDVLPYPFPEEYADEIHLYHVLEHLHNPIKKIENIHRILKKGGILYIRVPHFSSMGAFTDITHVRPFGYYSFDPFLEDSYQNFYSEIRFEILEREIKYLGLYPNNGFYEKYIHQNACPRAIRPLIKILNFVINLRPMFFERIWCYYVGGATEVYFRLKKV